MKDFFANLYPTTPPDEEPEAGPPVKRCAECRSKPVEAVGQLCEDCQREKAQGYRVLVLLGRLSNGNESDHGKLYHAVAFDTSVAFCGAKPGKRSVGWSEYHGKTVTCEKCAKLVEAAG